MSFLSYLALNHVAHIKEEVVAFQPNEMKQAEFISCRRRILRPPSNLGRHRLDHFTKVALPFSEEADHKKFLIHFSMQLQLKLGEEEPWQCGEAY